MNNTRVWIVALALVSFLAGSAAGALWTRKTNPQGDTGPFAAYAQELIRTFDLSPERAGHLRVLLREYESDIQRIKQAHRASYYASLEAELRPKGLEYNNYIRDKVLPPQQRESFNSLAAGLEVTIEPSEE